MKKRESDAAASVVANDSKMYGIEFVCVNVTHIKLDRSLIIKQSYGKV